ncbi:mercury methylation corrinoid protein HgcA [Desulfurivibrio alkaliphilus]|nr:mercury methylation corrinoid protein HgcA [Desulfurivibrio alkaliphilus]MDF1613490.1 mercury methylation corrinoid protein HgcA [Desulfurivibrio alkaliphilus]
MAAALSRRDRLGTLMVRCGLGRMNYLVEPGLYALGSPGAESPVLVGANYKLSFDHLRRALPGLAAWILVLDTGGINVWCAAGKGSFGTANLVRQLQISQLAGLVSHRQLIVPQLAAPGVNARLVAKEIGFQVRFGPVEAADLPAYLAAGGQATAAMRRKYFPWRERAVLIPVELVQKLPWLLPLWLLLGLLGWLAGPPWRTLAVLAAMALLLAVLAGQVLTPLLLPWLPGRAFAVKGLTAGLLLALALLGPLAMGFDGASLALSGLDLLAWPLLIGALASYLALEFTGASTYTSLSGVRKEARLAWPLQLAGGGLAVVLLLAGRLL